MKIRLQTKEAKQNTTKITIILALLIFAIVGYYAFLTGKAKDEIADSKMTAIEQILSRKMATDYPSTPKEVIKYYNDITRCIYNEDPDEEQTAELVTRMRELFDDDLLDINSYVIQLSEVMREQKEYKENKNSILAAAVASSTNVEFFKKDGYECASITSSYTIRADKKKVSYTNQYILRKDENKKWKIYGWVKQE